MTDLVDDNSKNPAPAGTVTPVVTPTIDPPVTMAPVSAGDISAPNNLTRVASGSIGVPTEFAPVGAGTISTPNALARVSGGNISAPNTLAGVTAGDISAPNTLNRIADGSVATPNTLAPVAAQHINRVVKPVISFDFGNQIYSKDGQPQTFADITTFTRASTATYVETYIDSLNRKQKRIATAAANTPRFEDAGLLVEGASTNLALRSEEFDNVYWTKFATASVTPNTNLAPDNSLSADTLTLANSGDYLLRAVAITTTIGSAATYSIFTKTGTKIITFGGATVAGTDEYSIETISNGWFRQSITRTFSVASTGIAQLLVIDAIAGLGSFIIWGAQFESLPFATSYIRTEGSAVSRAADNAFATTSQITTGSMLVESAYLGSTASIQNNRVSFGLSNNSGSDRLYFYNADGIQDALVYTVGGAVVQIFNNSTQRADQELRTSTFTFDVGSQAWYQEGTLGETGTNSSLPTGLTTITIGLVSSVAHIYGHIKRVQLYDTVLTASEVKAL